MQRNRIRVNRIVEFSLPIETTLGFGLPPVSNHAPDVQPNHRAAVFRQIAVVRFLAPPFSIRLSSRDLPLFLLIIGLVLVIGGSFGCMHAFLALALSAFVVGSLTPTAYLERHFTEEKGESQQRAKVLAEESIGKRLAGGFGRTCGKVGILIAMAAIIGTCLMESGAAMRIVRSSLSVFGEKKAPEAMAGSSFLLGIPVFFDTLFYLMVPLAKALALQTKRNYLLYVLAIVAGGAMTHSLVPPTPDPCSLPANLRSIWEE